MFPIATPEMDFSQETFAAFSNALAALYAAPDREARIASLVEQLRPLFGNCEVAIESADSPPAAADGREPANTLVVPIAGTPLRLILCRAGGLSAQSVFLAGQLRAHLAATIGRQPVAADRKPALAPADSPPSRLVGLGLTARECEVLYWVTKGKRDAEIAGIISAATRTVNKHVENILAKLGVETRLAAARAAADWLARKPSKS